MRTLPRLIEYQQQGIAIERFGTDTIKDLYTRTFSSGLFGKLRNRLTVMFVEADGYVTLSAFERRTLEWVNRESYLGLGELKVYVPKGLKVPYVRYLDALEQTWQELVKIDEELLAPSINLFADYVMGPQNTASASGLTGARYQGKLTTVDPKDTAKAISACFDPNGVDDTLPYKEALRNNGELKVVQERLSALQDNLVAMQADRIEKRVKELLKLSEGLSEILEANDDINMTAKVSKQLSERLYRCAEWVEFYAVYQRQVLVFAHAFNDTMEKLNRLAKGKK